MTGRAIKIPPIALKATSVLVITKCPGPLFGLEVNWCSTACILSATISTPQRTQLHPKCLLLDLWLTLIPDHAWALPQTLQFVPCQKQNSQFNSVGSYAELLEHMPSPFSVHYSCHHIKNQGGMQSSFEKIRRSVLLRSNYWEMSLPELRCKQDQMLKSIV